jgi:hypothetical protein
MVLYEGKWSLALREKREVIGERSLVRRSLFLAPIFLAPRCFFGPSGRCSFCLVQPREHHLDGCVQTMLGRV